MLINIIIVFIFGCGLAVLFSYYASYNSISLILLINFLEIVKQKVLYDSNLEEEGKNNLFYKLL